MAARTVAKMREVVLMLNEDRVSLLSRYLHKDKFVFYLSGVDEIVKLLDAIRELILATRGEDDVIPIMYPRDVQLSLFDSLEKRLPPGAWAVLKEGGFSIRWYGVNFELRPVAGREWFVGGFPILIKSDIG